MSRQSANDAACRWLSLSDRQLLAQCEVRHTRRSGPGGQHRNKVSTAVVLTHLPTRLRAEAAERRSQADNLAAALARLRLRLALACRATVQPASYRPGSLWQSRCAGGRIVVSPSHRDFAQLLAEALDVLAATEWNLTEAAALLGCSSSQLARLLARHDPAWQLLNSHRQQLGLGPLRR